MRPLPVRSDHRARPAPRLAPVILLIGFAVVALAARATAEIKFEAPFLAKGTGFLDQWIAVADFNRDGHMDAATAQLYGNSVSILLGKGDGTFASVTQVPATPSAGYIEAGDVNGDGFADLVMANSDSSISLFIGHGDGTFSPHVEYPTHSSQTGRRVIIEDLNGDGRGDVIVGGSIYPGQANGTLGAGIALGLTPLAVADVNGDGKPDLVTDEEAYPLPEGLAVRLGNGDFTFGPPILSDPSPPGGFLSVAAADVNGDGRLDVIFVPNGSPGGINVCLGHGDGTFGAPTTYPCSMFASRIAVGDFNGDGRADVAAIMPPPNSGYVMVRLGQGDGSLGPERVFVTGSDILGSDAADMNEDGFDDLVSTSRDGGAVCVLLANSDTSFGHLSEYPAELFAGFLEVGDLNGDGVPDVVVAGSSLDSLNVFLGDGAGHLGTARLIPVGLANANTSALGDLDGDGHLDLVLARSSLPPSYTPDSTIAFLGGHGDGTFGSPIITHPGVAPGLVSIVNANGDGTPDLAVGGYPNGCAVLMGHGDGTFSAPILTSTGTARVELFADLDGDGIPDLVATSTDTALVMFGAGDGTFGNATQIYSPYFYPGFGVAAGDLNGDGKVDLVFGGTGGFGGIGGTTVWFGAGGRTFVPGGVYSSPNPATLVGLVDFDHDGNLDIALQAGSWALRVLPGRGDGTFSSLPMDFGLGPNPFEVQFADLDGDGGPEVLSANGFGSFNGVVVLRNRSPLGSTAVPVTRLPATTPLVRATPNPAAGNRLSVSFALAGREPARLEVFDIAGRRVRSLDVTRFGPGLHQVDLATGSHFEPGLYVIRLSQARRQWTARAIVVE